MNAEEKLASLKRILAEAGSAAIALSGGTDSSFLLSVAASVPEFRTVAVTVNTAYMFASEVNESKLLCKRLGIKHIELELPVDGTIINNPPDRCYLCKGIVMSAIKKRALEEGLVRVFDGTNADDISDYRPGLKALREMDIRSPLLEAGLNKPEIRELARKAGLEMSDRPSNTCLLTRFPHNTRIVESELRRAEKAETLLKEMGFTGSRIRVHGDMVRIECRPDQFEDILKRETREKIITLLKESGYRYITLDLEGYRSGSMNVQQQER